ncbi:MAG: nicotinate-nucleotide adenylyltransferase, partial [Saprospiraceae bacterium]|nr:nicotinate-nucleotide adenylyltransferase [Saprospiraceae bacterium]
MKVGLFFGSFNPVHVGHMIIANFMAQNTDLDQVWMVVSPQNPLKKKNSLAKDRDRLHLVNLAIGDNLLLRSSDVEFSMPKPSYTIDTLAYLGEKYPEHEFVLIMGGDNLRTIHKWKNYEKLISDYEIYIYKRPKYSTKKWEDHATIKIYEAPLLDISASYIRDQVKRRHSIQYLVPQE